MVPRPSKSVITTFNSEKETCSSGILIKMPKKMKNKLIIRMSKNTFLKDKVYSIKINEMEETYKLGSDHNKIEIEVNSPLNTIEISNSKCSKKIVLEKSGSITFLNIYPDLSYEFALGVFIGFAFIASSVILFLSVTKGVNLLLIFMTFLPIFFVKKKNFEDRFKVKELKL